MNRIVRIIPVILSTAAIGLTASACTTGDQPFAAGRDLSAQPLDNRAWSPWSPPNHGRDTTLANASKWAAPRELPPAEASPLNVAGENRQRSEATRYRSYYGIDIGDLSPYDIVLSSETFGVDALAAIVDTAIACLTRQKGSL